MSPKLEHNTAFLFIKPHACNPKVVAVVKGLLSDASITVTDEGIITAEKIDRGGLIDAHYGTLAERAMHVAAIELPVWSPGKAAEFEAKFGTSHTSAAADGKLLNLKEAMALMPELSAQGAWCFPCPCACARRVQLSCATEPLRCPDIEKAWRAGECLKLAPGTCKARPRP